MIWTAPMACSVTTTGAICASALSAALSVEWLASLVLCSTNAIVPSVSAVPLLALSCAAHLLLRIAIISPIPAVRARVVWTLRAVLCALVVPSSAKSHLVRMALSTMSAVPLAQRPAGTIATQSRVCVPGSVWQIVFVAAAGSWTRAPAAVSGQTSVPMPWSAVTTNYRTIVALARTSATRLRVIPPQTLVSVILAIATERQVTSMQRFPSPMASLVSGPAAPQW